MEKEEREALREQYEKEGACSHCGGMHLRACPRVQSMTFHPDGKLAGVRFWREWDSSETVWPEDLFDEMDEPGRTEGD